MERKELLKKLYSSKGVIEEIWSCQNKLDSIHDDMENLDKNKDKMTPPKIFIYLSPFIFGILLAIEINTFRAFVVGAIIVGPIAGVFLDKM